MGAGRDQVRSRGPQFRSESGVDRIIRYLGGGALPAVLETVAVAVHLQDVNVVGEPVKQSAGEPLGAEHVGPLVEGQVGGDQDGAPFVALAEDLEEQFRSGGGQGDKAQLIDGHRYDAPSWFPSQGGYLGFLRGYDHLKRGGWNVAQSILVDVDTLDDGAVLGPINDLLLRVLGLVQRQSQLIHRFHLLVVTGPLLKSGR